MHVQPIRGTIAEEVSMHSTREPYYETPEKEQVRTSPAFVLGILSLVFLLISPQIISLVLGIIGLVIGARDRKRGDSCIRAEAGWTMSLIGVVLSSIMIFLVIAIIMVAMTAIMVSVI